MVNLLIYFTLFFVCIFSSYLAIRRKKTKINGNILFPYLIIGITLYAVIVGLRWNVGKDYLSYYYLLNNAVYDWEIRRLEIIPRYLIYFIRDNHLPPFLWFIIMAWFHVFFFSKSFNNKLYFLLPLSMFFYLGIQFGASLNIIRQCVAYSIALWAYTLIPKRKVLPFCATIVLGYLFHRSIIIILPLFFLTDKHILSIKAQFLLLISSYFVGKLVMNIILNSDFLWQLFGYENVQERIIDNVWTVKEGTGYGIIINYFRYFVLMAYSHKLKGYYATSLYTLFYNIFFIGICLYGLMDGDMYLSRAFDFFRNAEFLITASFIYYAVMKSKHRFEVILSFIILILQLVIIAYSALSSETWSFLVTL